MAASSSSSMASTLRETVDAKIRDKIAESAIRRDDNVPRSLAYEHLDLRIHPPRGSLLLGKGSPYSRIDLARLKGILPYMLVEKRPPGQPVLCDLGFARGFFRCFVDCTPDTDRDVWHHKRMFYRVPVSGIKTTAEVDVEETRAFKAYAKHQSVSESSLAARAPFNTPTLAMKAPENCTVLDAVVNFHRFTPPPENRVGVNVQDELYNDAINHLPPQKRHELHLKHCCPWTAVASTGGDHCKCPGYSGKDPRTRLPSLLPELAFGVKGCQDRLKEIQKRVTSVEFLKQHQENHSKAVWERSMRKLMGPDTRTCIATALLRLLAAYEMCGSVYGAAVVATRFIRFFVLGPNRIAVEILPIPRVNFGGLPRPLPWSTRDLSEAKKAYVERMPKPRNVPPPVRPPRGVVSEAQASSLRFAKPPRPPRRSLPGPKTPPRTPPRTPPSSAQHDDAMEVRYGMPDLGQIPAAHILRTPPRKVSSKMPFLGLRKPKQPTFEVTSRTASRQVTVSPHSSPASGRTKASTVNKPLPPAPEPLAPVCRLPVDYRSSLSYQEVFTEDVFNRLPWSLAVWAGQESKRGEPRTTRCNLDIDAVHAFSNLFTAAMIRIGQIPRDYLMGPLPLTNQYPRDEAVTALANTSGLPAELAEPIVDLALALDEPPCVQRLREAHCIQQQAFAKSATSLSVTDQVGSPHTPANPRHHPIATHKTPSTPSTLVPDLRAMERALAETVRFVPVSRGEMEALIGRQVRADRRRYFSTYPASRWPEYWTAGQQKL